jgi:hypothetical protein
MEPPTSGHYAEVTWPLGVRALAIFMTMLAVVLLLFAALTFFGPMPLSAGAFLLGGGGLEQLGPIVFALYAVILGVLAMALVRRWKGARRLTMLLAVVGIALAVPAISSAVVDQRWLAVFREGLQIIVRVVVIFYLSQEGVKEWFAAAAEAAE